MLVRFKSEDFASRLTGIAAGVISSYVRSFARHFRGMAVEGPDGAVFLAEPAIELVLEIHSMAVGDGLSFSQIDAELDGEGRIPLPFTRRAWRTLKAMGELWRQDLDDPVTGEVTRSYCEAIFDGALRVRSG
jgi:hypothetical protein